MKKNTPLVSVIMNCFNGERYVSQSIKSVINQSYKNWELIFWDNNSSDNSKNLCKKFKDKRIKYFYSKNYYKLYKSRNLALQKAKGKFITFLDTDDLWYKNKIKDQIKFLLKNNFKICYSNYLMFNESKRKKKLLGKKKNYLEVRTQELLDYYDLGILTVMMEKSLFKKKNLTKNMKLLVILTFLSI